MFIKKNLSIDMVDHVALQDLSKLVIKYRFILMQTNVHVCIHRGTVI